MTEEDFEGTIKELEAQLSDQIKWVKRAREYGDDPQDVSLGEWAEWSHKWADRIEELEGKLARSERYNEALEELRPVWAQGWTDDSQAAQVSSSALAQLWEMLGASNQTQAVEALAKLKGTKYYD